MWYGKRSYRRVEMSRTLASLLASLFLLSSSTLAGAYDLSDRYLTHHFIDNIRQSTIPLQIRRKYQDVDDQEQEEGVQGTGTVLCDNETGKRYILMTEHLFPANKKLSFYVRTRGMRIEKITRTSKKDLALLETDDTTHPCLKGKVGTDYHVGDFVLYIGYPKGESPFLRESRLMSYLDDEHILHEAHYSPGDSGGGVFGSEFGEPRLIGISQLFLYKDCQEKPWAVAINGKLICEFLQGTAVHDEYCGGEKK